MAGSGPGETEDERGPTLPIKGLVTRFRNFAEKAVTEGRISPKERRETLDLFREGLSGYAYFES